MKVREILFEAIGSQTVVWDGGNTASAIQSMLDWLDENAPEDIFKVTGVPMEKLGMSKLTVQGDAPTLKRIFDSGVEKVIRSRGTDSDAPRFLLTPIISHVEPFDLYSKGDFVYCLENPKDGAYKSLGPNGLPLTSDVSFFSKGKPDAVTVFPMVYIINLKSGTVSYGSALLHLRAEIVSGNANEFNKKKSGFPGDLEKSLEVAVSHYKRYVGKVK